MIYFVNAQRQPKKIRFLQIRYVFVVNHPFSLLHFRDEKKVVFFYFTRKNIFSPFLSHFTVKKISKKMDAWCFVWDSQLWLYEPQKMFSSFFAWKYHDATCKNMKKVCACDFFWEGISKWLKSDFQVGWLATFTMLLQKQRKFIKNYNFFESFGILVRQKSVHVQAGKLVKFGWRHFPEKARKKNYFTSVVQQCLPGTSLLSKIVVG